MSQTTKQKQAEQLYNIRERIFYWQTMRQDADDMVKSLFKEERNLQKIMKSE